MRGLRAYDSYLSHREKSGKPDSRDFIPMPETWLNQDRWASEYPEEVKKAIVKEPVSGKDFYWKDCGSGGETVLGRFWIRNGEQTDERFKDQEWKELRKKELGI